ncbi:MAG TPA: tyrosine-type recombinase/integrase [Steroidobacteraceae bacterium]|nr:tyrosine-type recombinase/integrase [Steroidobacteraceae bacterium]
MLTDTDVRQAKASGEPYKLADGGGLYLFIAHSGRKTWRYDFRFLRRRQTLTIGPYPEVSLKEARRRHRLARERLEAGENPATAKQREKAARNTAAANTLAAVANEWLEEVRPHRSHSWGVLIGGWWANHINPVLGSRPLDAVEPSDVLGLMRKIAAAGHPRTAECVRWAISRVYGYAIRNLKTRVNPAREIQRAIQLPPTRHHPSLTAKELPDFLRKIDGYQGRPETRIALKLLALTFVRGSELVGAAWSEIELDDKQWRIPPERMKMSEQHIVPLSRQAIALLKELKPLSGHFPHLFPHLGDPKRAMSDETIREAFKTLGYGGKFTPHGIRSTASTLLNEQGWRPDVIERQLAHAERDRIRAAYNHADYLDERRKMMQAWANYLDALSAEGKVINIKSRA